MDLASLRPRLLKLVASLPPASMLRGCIARFAAAEAPPETAEMTQSRVRCARRPVTHHDYRMHRR